MAKSAIAQKRQSISTNAMFKKPGKEALRAVKTNKVIKGGKQMKQVQHGPEHELSASFSECIEKSREHIGEAAANSYETTYAGLCQRLMDIDDRYLQNEQACAKSVKEHTLPFKNGTLEWISDDGKKTGTVVLGHRMKKLQKITDAEEAELTRQYIEWLEVQAEIDAIAAEIAGPDHIPDQSATGRLSKTDVLVAEQMELQREITEEKAKFLKMMDEAAAFSKKALIESEQELDLRQQKVEDSFMSILREEAYSL